jgi:hypothetical protein
VKFVGVFRIQRMCGEEGFLGVGGADSRFTLVMSLQHGSLGRLVQRDDWETLEFTGPATAYMRAYTNL